MLSNSRLLSVIFVAFISLISGACSGGGAEPPPAATAAAPRVVDLKKSAEARLLPGMLQPVQEWVRAQEFFNDLTQAEYDFVDTLRKTEKAFIRHGAEAGLYDTLALISAQPWAQDGITDDEAKNLKGLFLAHEVSLEEQYVPDLEKVVKSTLEGNYLRTLSLPESGEVTVMVGTDFPELGLAAFDVVLAEMAKVESLVGPFPYPFLYVWVTELPQYLAGLSVNEFIALSPDYVEAETVAHEITHATLYGIFPIWFEEGFAYFMEAYATDNIPGLAAYHRAMLGQQRKTQKLDLAARFDHARASYTAELSQGFLFFNGLYDIEGIEGLGRIVRALRSKTYTNDNELLHAIVSNSAPENQLRVQQYLCQTVIGLRSGC